jgi:hypothetical protein
LVLDLAVALCLFAHGLDRGLVGLLLVLQFLDLFLDAVQVLLEFLLLGFKTLQRLPVGIRLFAQVLDLAGQRVNRIHGHIFVVQGVNAVFRKPLVQGFQVAVQRTLLFQVLLRNRKLVLQFLPHFFQFGLRIQQRLLLLLKVAGDVFNALVVLLKGTVGLFVLSDHLLFGLDGCHVVRLLSFLVLNLLQVVGNLILHFLKLVLLLLLHLLNVLELSSHLSQLLLLLLELGELLGEFLLLRVKVCLETG